MQKTLTTFLTFVLIANIISAANSAYAFFINDSFCEISGEVPDPAQIVCPFVRLYNGFILAAGVVLTIMIAIGGIKLSMSLGDPKGYQAASRTWTYTLWGVGIVFGAFFLVRTLNYTLGLGLPFSSPTGMFEFMGDKINKFLCTAFIIQDGVDCPI